MMMVDEVSEMILKIALKPMAANRTACARRRAALGDHSTAGHQHLNSCLSLLPRMYLLHRAHRTYHVHSERSGTADAMQTQRSAAFPSSDTARSHVHSTAHRRARTRGRRSGRACSM